jgi:hypothetical protein
MRGVTAINLCLAQQKNLIGEPTAVMFRRSMSQRGFKTNYRQLVDLEMWFHLLEQGSFAYINDPLCSFRLHGQQQSEKNKVNFAILYDNFYLLHDYLDKEYITLSFFMRQYLLYEKVYAVHKLYRKGVLDHEAAHKLIDQNYGYARFLAYYPLYKTIKPCNKLLSKLMATTPEPV